MSPALRKRGVHEPAASLTAEAGIAVFRIAFAGWVRGPGNRELADLTREGFAALRSLVA